MGLLVEDLLKWLIPLEIEKLLRMRLIGPGWDIFEQLDARVDDG
jgi:hypothetical protein